MGKPLGRVSMRSRLQQLSIGATLPLAVAGAIALAALVRLQRDAAELSALELTRALATAVRVELGGSVSTLQALAASPSIDAARMDDFAATTARVLAQRPDWMAILLIDPDGRLVDRRGGGATAAMTATVERDSFDTAIKTLKPQIGQLTAGPGGERGVPVRVPVVRDGQLRYVLTAVVRPEALRDLLVHQQVPEGGVISVFDRDQHRIARSKAHEQHLASGPSPALKKLLETESQEGSGQSVSLEGDSTLAAFVRLPETGWTIAVGLPTSVVNASTRHALLFYGGGLVASLLLALMLARLLARGINRPIAELRLVAQALGRGERIAPPTTRIAEVHEVGEALAGASEQLLHARQERQGLLAASDAARHRFERVAAAGETLSRSLEARATLDAVAAIVVPAIADWVRIDLFDAEGSLNCSLIHHGDPARAERLYALATTVHGAEERAGSPEWTARTGQSYIRRFEKPQDVDSMVDPVYQRVVREFGLRMQFTLPLVARGRTIGALAVAQAESGRDIDGDEQALVADLALRFALALDNSRLYEEARAARAQAEHASAAKDEFLAMLGHELRNPLAPIVSTLAILERRGDAAIARERQVLQRQVNHLVRLVDDMLDVSRITRGKVTMQRSRVDLRHVVDRALELVPPDAVSRVVVSRPAGELPVDGDAVRLSQLVSNLLGNALKFSPANRRVHLVVSQDGDELLLEVIDDGIGIAPKLLPFIFEPFFQAEQALGRPGGGLGLGLAIVKALVELHGGTVTAHSAGEGHGCRFAVRLPLASSAARVEARDALSGLAVEQKMRLMVVDDNVDAAESITLLLQQHGFEVRMAHSGEDALLQLDGTSVDAALVDIGLPGMDGYELAACLRARGDGESIRLIALTGYGRQQDRAKAIAAGFDVHLAKPVTPEELIATLLRLSAGRFDGPLLAH